jgi:hypothetical protein
VDDTTAHVLRDVVDSGETVGKWPFRSPVFHGTVVPPGQLQARLDAESPRVSDRWNPLQHRKALLCVHGFDSQPESWLRRCAENYGKSDELAIIPVIWPGTFFRCGTNHVFLANAPPDSFRLAIH